MASGALQNLAHVLSRACRDQTRRSFQLRLPPVCLNATRNGLVRCRSDALEIRDPASPVVSSLQSPAVAKLSLNYHPVLDSRSIQARPICQFLVRATPSKASTKMAILTGYPGLEVTVEVDGQRAQEYDAPADEVEARAKETNFYSIPQVPIQGSGSPYTIKYIESKPGKPFAFEIDSTNFFIPSPDAKKHMVEYQCFLDGTPTGYYRLVGGTKKRMRSYKSGNNNSGWKRHEFQFSTLEIGKINASRPRAISYPPETLFCLHQADLHLLKWKEETRNK